MKNASVIFALIVTLTLWFALTKLDAKVGEFTGEDYLHQCTSIDPNRNLKNDLEQAMAVYCVGYIDAAVTMIAHMDGQSFLPAEGHHSARYTQGDDSVLANTPRSKTTASCQHDDCGAAVAPDRALPS